MLKTAIALVGALLAAPALARDYCAEAVIPKNIKPPTVNVDVHIMPRAQIHKLGCALSYRDVTACSYADPHDARTWIVLISSDVPAGRQFDCIMQYEQAHMPPNFWVDPAVETPETVKQNEADRRKYLAKHRISTALR